MRNAGEDVEKKGRGQAQLVDALPRPAEAGEPLPAHASHSAGGTLTKPLQCITVYCHGSASTAKRTVGGGGSQGRTIFCVTPNFSSRGNAIPGVRVTGACSCGRYCSTIRKAPNRTAPTRQTQSQMSHNVETIWEKNTAKRGFFCQRERYASRSLPSRSSCLPRLIKNPGTNFQRHTFLDESVKNGVHPSLHLTYSILWRLKRHIELPPPHNTPCMLASVLASWTTSGANTA